MVKGKEFNVTLTEYDEEGTKYFWFAETNVNGEHVNGESPPNGTKEEAIEDIKFNISQKLHIQNNYEEE